MTCNTKRPPDIASFTKRHPDEKKILGPRESKARGQRLEFTILSVETSSAMIEGGDLVSTMTLSCSDPSASLSKSSLAFLFSEACCCCC